MKIIDCHTHTFPDKIAVRAIEKLSKVSGTKAFTDGTEGMLRESSHANNIEYSIILPVATSKEQVDKINDGVIELKDSREANGIISFGAMHPDFENPEAEIARLAENGIIGIKLHPAYTGTDMDDARHIRILKAAAKEGLFVTTHAGIDIGIPEKDYCDLDMVKRCLDEVPDIKLILAHMGAWGNWDKVGKALKGADVYMDTSMSFGLLTARDDVDYETLPKLMTPLEFTDLCHEIGVERILFGTDCPWRAQKESIENLLDTPLSTEEKELIFYKNAKQLLSL